MTHPAAQYENLSLTVGRDYRTSDRYEFVLMNGNDDDAEIVERKGFFTSSAQARRAGLKAAEALLAPSLF